VGFFGRKPEPIEEVKTAIPNPISVTLDSNPKLTIRVESHDSSGWVIGLHNEGKSPFQLQLDDVVVHFDSWDWPKCSLELHYLGDTLANPGKDILLLLKLLDSHGKVVKPEGKLNLWYRSITDSESPGVDDVEFHETWLDLPGESTPKQPALM
jgi:hypothetical protein